ncbi:hypothetical protein JX266_005790 [Neoarthrinium moseri]|nr:hypothetical protein JX266_005790 [Neoarthrinium moseri]
MFVSRFLLSVTLLTAIDAVAALETRACDDSWIEIVDQTDIDFYKTCPNIDGTLFFIDHLFKGPFELPGVKSLPEVSSGYLGPKLKGSDRVDDGVTSVSMPDLTNITSGGILFGYVNNLTSVSFPNLNTITGDLAIIDSYPLRNISLPALTTVNGGVLLDGHFDQISLPSLKSVSFLRVLSTGDISCPALGAAFASLTFTPKKTDIYSGFTCWTGYENNRWNSSDPEHNPTIDGTSPTSTGSGSGSATNTKASAANAPRVGYVEMLLFSVGVLCLSH